MNTSEIAKALRGETSAAVIYWDKQDTSNVGPAYRVGTQESGSLEMTGWAHVSGRPIADAETQGYNIADYFLGPDGRYRGPDQDGIYPILD